MKNKTKTYLFITTILFQLLTIALFLLNYLFFTNTLSNNRNWSVSKTELFIPGNDGETFKNFTQALAGNSLNLSAWRGYHELTLKKSIDWYEITFKFLPAEDSYLYTVFNKDSDTNAALRISFSRLYEDALVNVKYTGEFINQLKLENFPEVKDGWQKITLNKVSPANIEISFNDKYLTTYHSDQPIKNGFGFRAGKNKILVDDFVLKDSNEKIILKDNFDNLNKFGSIFYIISILIIFFDLTIFHFFSNKRKRFEFLTKLNFTFCNTLILTNLILLPVNSMVRSRYPKNDPESPLNITHILKRSNNLNHWFQVENRRILAEISSGNQNLETKKIIFIGSSQTSGEGAARIGEDFVSKFSDLLDKNLTNNKQKFTVINASLSGEISSSLLKYFRFQWLELKPDMVIVNLSSNDEKFKTKKNFESSLEDFIYLSKKYNFKLVFVAEANSFETKEKLENHKIMKDIAEKNNITFIDMHNYLIDKNNTGIIWWDFVHATSYGYELIANHLFDSLKEEILKLK